MTLLLLLAGLLLLFKGADYLVAGSASIARRLGIPTLVIGLTLVAFGTSAPEFVVSFFASLRGANEIAIGNIVGSNILNILLILGVSALITHLPVRSSTVWKEIPFAVLAAIVLWIMMNDRFLNHQSVNEISFAEGLLLLLFFCIFIIYTISFALRERTNMKTVKKEYTEEVKAKYIESLPKAILAFTFGLLAIILGGKFLVESSVSIAKFFGVSEALIGLTVAAVGTSLPELAASAVAAYRKEPDIAVGNIVGSNIFNILLILGVSALPNPLSVSSILQPDTIVMIAATILLFVFAFTGRKLTRLEGVIFLGLYAIYLWYIIQRG